MTRIVTFKPQITTNDQLFKMSRNKSFFSTTPSVPNGFFQTFSSALGPSSNEKKLSENQEILKEMASFQLKLQQMLLDSQRRMSNKYNLLVKHRNILNNSESH